MASTQEFKTQVVLPADPSAAMQAATKQYVDTSLLATQTGTFPAGAIIPFGGSSAPSGWLLCAGQAVSRTTYANLYSIIGTTYGAGDGSTTFNLPDLRGRVAAGKDDMNGSAANRITSATSGITGTTLGAAGGDQRLHNHNHGITDPGHNHGLYMISGGGGAFAPNYSMGTATTAYAATVPNTTGITINNNTHGGGSQNVQPTMMLNYIISTGVGTTTRLWAEGRKTTTQTIPDVTSTNITSYSAETDPYGFFNTTTGKFTLPVAGLWNFSFFWQFNADTTNWNHTAINNETKVVPIAALRTASGPYANSLSGMLECSAGDVISAGIFADTASGATLNYARFNAALIGT